MLMLTPTDGSSTYLGRKKRLLDQHVGAERNATTLMAARDSKLVFPFERVSSGMVAEADHQEGLLLNEESTVREEEYGDESEPGRDLVFRERLPNESLSMAEESNLHPEQQLICFSVMEGVQLEQGMADRWLNN